jgi:catechol 2,3-dioxygenase-like lactoylglutathione lyase family enzyme
MNIDHVVLWVDSPTNSLAFFVDVVGLRAVREFTGDGGDGGGRPINHICLSMNATEYSALRARLLAQEVDLVSGGEHSFGAQGVAERSEYFRDPDGNKLNAFCMG